MTTFDCMDAAGRSPVKLAELFKRFREVKDKATSRAPKKTKSLRQIYNEKTAPDRQREKDERTVREVQHSLRTTIDPYIKPKRSLRSMVYGKDKAK